MQRQKVLALAVAFSLASAATQSALVSAAQQNAAIYGTAKDEAKKPYPEFTVRARDVQQGQVTATTVLSDEGNFALQNLSSAKYLVELVNKDGKVVCTEGPFDLQEQMMRNNVVIDCDKILAAWWLLGAAGAAGITAGVVAAGGGASGAQ